MFKELTKEELHEKVTDAFLLDGMAPYAFIVPSGSKLGIGAIPFYAQVRPDGIVDLITKEDSLIRKIANRKKPAALYSITSVPEQAEVEMKFLKHCPMAILNEFSDYELCWHDPEKITFG